MSNKKEKLFSEFPPVSTEEWMAKITEDLKGADFEKKLVWRTNEGFKVQPFYRQEDLQGLDTETKPGEQRPNPENFLTNAEPRHATVGLYVRVSAPKTSRRPMQRLLIS